LKNSERLLEFWARGWKTVLDTTSVVRMLFDEPIHLDVGDTLQIKWSYSESMGVTMSHEKF